MCSTAYMPNGAVLELFLVSIVCKITPIGDELPSLSLIKVGFRPTLMGLILCYPTFSLSKCDSIRIKSVFHTLSKEGCIARNLFRDTQWIRALLLQRMILRGPRGGNNKLGQNDTENIIIAIDWSSFLSKRRYHERPGRTNYLSLFR